MNNVMEQYSVQPPQATSQTPPAMVDDDRRAGIAARIFRRIPFDKVNWTTSSFLIGTFILSLTLVPAYIWLFGLDWFQVALFLVMFFAVGFSITLGYHRLYSHLTFQAHWSVRLFTLIFGAAAFETRCCSGRVNTGRITNTLIMRTTPTTFGRGFSRHTSAGCFQAQAAASV